MIPNMRSKSGVLWLRLTGFCLNFEAGSLARLVQFIFFGEPLIWPSHASPDVQHLGSIPSVIRSIFLSNKVSLLGTVEILLLIDDLCAIAADEVAVGILYCLLFTSSCVPSFQLYKRVFNTFLFRYKVEINAVEILLIH